MEILLLESGELTAQVGERALTIGAGDLFLMGNVLRHSVGKSGNAARHIAKAIAVYFLPELIRSGDLPHEDIEYLKPFLAQDHQFPHVIPAATGVPAQVRDLIVRIESELPAQSDLNRLAVKTYLKLILVLLGNHYASLKLSHGFVPCHERDLGRLKPVFDFIEQHYSERLTLEQASALLHMSPSHFMRLFRRATGEPMVSYLNRFRIAKAETLLASTSKTVAQVSQEVGFCDQSYFGYVFRKLLHITPRDYRERRAPLKNHSRRNR